MEQTLKISDGFKIQGRVKVIVTESLRANGFLNYLWQKYILGKKTGKFLREIPWNHNLIMLGTNTGKQLILNRLGGDNTYSMNILYADIGTDATTPDVSDTTLGAAVARASLPVIAVSANLLSFQFFWPDGSLANGSYYEIGTFIDGTSSIDTGQIFNHALFSSAYVKGSLEDTTVQIDFITT